jgi:hypothetical protein
MDKLISKIQNYSFSNTDMKKLVEGKASIVSYPMLKKYKTIDQLLGKNKAVIILYLTGPQYGHWTCLFKTNYKKPTLCFFDPYGYSPDYQLRFNSPEKNIQLGQDRAFLSELLYNSKYDVEYNNTRLQKLKKNNNVCGRWVGLRLNFRDWPTEEFVKVFTNIKHYSPDWMATALSSLIS